jgi:hypothetical protein
MAQLNKSQAPSTPSHAVPGESSADSPSNPQAGERYRLALIKGEHRWTFRWDPGCESQLIDRVAALAAEPHAPLDWYDAAVLCRHIAQPFPSATKPRPAA